MKYYRVKPQYDNYKLSRSFEILVGTELFTAKEWEKACIKWANRNTLHRGENKTVTPAIKQAFSRMFDIVEVSKNKTYWFFGARFEMGGRKACI
jgi:hypothetical protein